MSQRAFRRAVFINKEATYGWLFLCSRLEWVGSSAQSNLLTDRQWSEPPTRFSQRSSAISALAMRCPFSPTSAAPAEVSTATTVLSPEALTTIR